MAGPNILASEVLTYLCDHPDSQDSLEGIARWWILERTIQCRLSEVERALAWLVVRGRLLQERTLDGVVYYRANPKCLSDETKIRQALGGESKPNTARKVNDFEHKFQTKEFKYERNSKRTC